MNTIPLNAGFSIPKLGLGTWAIGGGSWWGDSRDTESVRAIHEAIDIGMNLVDTAPLFGFGHSEEIVGRAIADRRDKVILATKCGLVWNGQGALFFQRDGREVRRSLSAESIREEVVASLRRLGTEYIDLYITHWPSLPAHPTPVSETVGALLELRDEGLIRAVGAANTTPEIVDEYLEHGRLDLIQERYSLLNRETEERFALCGERGIAVMAYAALEQGLLTGKYPRDYRVREQLNVRRENIWFEQKNLTQVWNMMDEWEFLCEKYDCTKAQLAVAWTAAQWEGLHVLCGARSARQVRDSARGLQLQLEEEDLEAMRQLAEGCRPA